jgi:hypothetical protein
MSVWKFSIKDKYKQIIKKLLERRKNVGLAESAEYPLHFIKY